MTSRKVLDIMREFDTYLKVERNLSAKTRDAYNFDLKKFVVYLIKKQNDEPTLDVLSTKEIKEYLAYLQADHNYKSSTLSRTISSIRCFFEFAIAQGYAEKSPTANIRNPKLPKKLPIYLIDSELKRLLTAPDLSKPMEVRDYSILVALAFTGMRLKELVGLKINDIDFERNTIKIFGKGAKERLTPMNKLVRDALAQYLGIRPITDDDSVFLNKYKKGLTGRSVENIVKKYVLRSGILSGKKKISPHKLRHTFATLLHIRNVDIIEIQNLLGHQNIVSTQIYTHTNPTRLKSAVDKLVE